MDAHIKLQKWWSQFVELYTTDWISVS